MLAKLLALKPITRSKRATRASLESEGRALTCIGIEILRDSLRSVRNVLRTTSKNVAATRLGPKLEISSESQEHEPGSLMRMHKGIARYKRRPTNFVSTAKKYYRSSIDAPLRISMDKYSSSWIGQLT